MLLLAAAVATNLNLECPGVWTVASTDTAFVHGHSVFVDSTAAFDSEVRVEISGNEGRLLEINGKKIKSRPLTKVTYDGSQVQARLPSFLWDHPRVVIDLAAQRIRINEIGGSFLGVCRPEPSGDPSQAISAPSTQGKP